MTRVKRRERVSLIPDLTDRRSYVDTVGVRMPRLLEKPQFRDLRMALVQELRPHKRRMVLERIRLPPPSDGFHLVLWIHQPTVNAIEILKRDCRCHLYSVHVALDLFTPSAEHAGEVQRYLERRLQKNGRPATPLRRVQETVYIGESACPAPRRGTKLAMYSDKPSKITGGPCTHVEFRTTGATWLEAKELGSLDAVMELDHQNFWAKRLRLRVPPRSDRLLFLMAERLARWQRTHGTRVVSPRQKRVEVASDVLASECDRLNLESVDASSNDALYACHRIEGLSGRMPPNLFKHEDAFWMLPVINRNALWTDCSERQVGVGSIERTSNECIKMPEYPYLMQELRDAGAARGTRRPRVPLFGIKIPLK